jgi:hypothetical protein
VQDHGGYLLGVPLLMAATISGFTLVAARRSRDKSTKSVLDVLAALTVAAPLLATACASAVGVLTFDLLAWR